MKLAMVLISVGIASVARADRPKLLAEPARGGAPLVVSFSYELARVAPFGFYFDFGDGSRAAAAIGCGIVGGDSNACPRSLVAAHTFVSAGDYLVKLHDGRRGCAPLDCDVIGRVTIHVD